MTSPAVGSGMILALPLGSCEQHGPHLPLGTDTAIATFLAEELASARGDVAAAPALPYGASGEHSGFPGTLSLGTTALRDVVVELVRSADHFAATVIVSGHGGNADGLDSAAAILTAEGRRVLVWSPPRSVSEDVAEGCAPDAHAGWVETSVMLAIAAEGVHIERATVGDTRPLREILPELQLGGVLAVSKSGVLGDPTGASAEIGRRLVSAWATDLIRTVDAWHPRDRARS